MTTTRGSVTAERTRLDRSWAVARSAGDDRLADLVARLPDDVVLTPRDVVVLADDLASPCGPARARTHATLLRRLRPAQEGTLDLCTLVASAPGVEPCVLDAALDQLAAAGHPSRTVLLRVAGRAADGGAVDHARALVRNLVRAGGDDDVPLRLLALLAAPAGGQPDGRSPLRRAVAQVVLRRRRR